MILNNAVASNFGFVVPTDFLFVDVVLLGGAEGEAF